MAATRITPIEPTGSYADEAAATQFATSSPTALDATNGNIISLDTDILLFIENTDAGAQTVTITGVADSYGRYNTGISAYSLAASAKVSRIFKRAAWADAAGDLNITGSSANLELTAYKL